MHWSSTIVKSSGSLPPIATLLKNSDALPVSVAVTVCAALVVPVFSDANDSDAGEIFRAGDPAVVAVVELPAPPPPWSPIATAGKASPASAAATTSTPRTLRLAIIAPPQP